MWTLNVETFESVYAYNDSANEARNSAADVDTSHAGDDRADTAPLHSKG